MKLENLFKDFEELVDLVTNFDSFKIKSPFNAKHHYDEKGKEHVLTIQAAGFKKENINIEINSKGLEIKGEITNEKLKENVCRNKFHYILHKNDVDSDSIEASLEDGLLIVKFKTSLEKNTKKVEIK